MSPGSRRIQVTEGACHAVGGSGVVLVLCNGYFVFTTVDKNGHAQTQNGRESTTLVRVGGRWLIANFHFSAVF